MLSLLSNPVFLTFAFLTITNVAWAVSHFWGKYRQAEFDANLKHEMLSQGMSADDIVKVLEASSGSRKSETQDAPALAIKEATQAL